MWGGGGGGSHFGYLAVCIKLGVQLLCADVDGNISLNHSHLAHTNTNTHTHTHTQTDKGSVTLKGCRGAHIRCVCVDDGDGKPVHPEVLL